jgi:transcriptional regulator GlxA family with amidase domain
MSTDVISAPIRFGFLLLPGYSMDSFASAIDTLKSANKISRKKLYDYQLITSDGITVTADNGLQIKPDDAMTNIELNKLDRLIVCGGHPDTGYLDPSLIAWLKQSSTKNKMLGAIGSGTYLLARARLLDGYRCSFNWNNISRLCDEFPGILFSTHLFSIDRDRFTCLCGSPVIDMMLHFIKKEQGLNLAAKIADFFCYERIRDYAEVQLQPKLSDHNKNSTILSEAISMMTNNLCEPLSILEIAQYTDLSQRHLERLFKKHLDCSPGRFYLNFRLETARNLLLTTDRSIKEIGQSCGFPSNAHFSKSYRELHGQSPRDARCRLDPIQHIPYYRSSLSSETEHESYKHLQKKPSIRLAS